MHPGVLMQVESGSGGTVGWLPAWVTAPSLTPGAGDSAAGQPGRHASARAFDAFDEDLHHSVELMLLEDGDEESLPLRAASVAWETGPWVTIWETKGLWMARGVIGRISMHC
jgi:hypothetical protein